MPVSSVLNLCEGVACGAAAMGLFVSKDRGQWSFCIQARLSEMIILKKEDVLKNTVESREFNSSQ